MRERLRGDERAVSIAVTHVLTIGMTTILISGLLIGAAGMLNDQQDRAGQNELQAIGDRTAGEIVTAVDRGNRTDGSVNVSSRQPSDSVAGSYSVQLTNASHCRVRDGYDACLTLFASGQDRTAEIPISFYADVEVVDGSATGGQVVVEYDRGDRTDPDDHGDVTIRGER